MNRRSILQSLGLVLAGWFGRSSAQASTHLTQPLPSTGWTLPPVDVEADRMRQSREAEGWLEPSPWRYYEYEGYSYVFSSRELAIDVRHLMQRLGRYPGGQLSVAGRNHEVVITEAGQESWYPLWQAEAREALARRVAQLQSRRNDPEHVQADAPHDGWLGGRLYAVCSGLWKLLGEYNQMYCTGCHGCCCGEHLPSKMEITITGVSDPDACEYRNQT